MGRCTVRSDSGALARAGFAMTCPSPLAIPVLFARPLYKREMPLREGLDQLADAYRKTARFYRVFVKQISSAGRTVYDIWTWEPNMGDCCWEIPTFTEWLAQRERVLTYLTREDTKES